MKRKYTPEYPKIKKVKPLLWRKCILCDYEYRKESIYKIRDLFYVMGEVIEDNIYICENCASSKEDVISKYKEYVLGDD